MVSECATNLINISSSPQRRLDFQRATVIVSRNFNFSIFGIVLHNISL